MIHKITDNNWDAALKAKKAVVDFSAEWCGPCKMLGPVMQELSEEMPDVEFYNADTDQNIQLAIQNGISSIPALLLFEDGELKDTTVGFMPKDAVKSWIEKAR
ncbi:MAG: thioredoxin [Lachnospiraceae bacterium]|nr:thioredoxin [Lachnospiraceae bacterium]